MGKISQEQRNLYFGKVKEYKKLIDARLAIEKDLQDNLDGNGPGLSYKRIAAAEEAINVASHYMLINSVSVALLGIKNDDYLTESRRAIARAIKHFEDTVTSYIDVPYSDYEKNLEEISELSPQVRYQLLMKLGFCDQGTGGRLRRNVPLEMDFHRTLGQVRDRSQKPAGSQKPARQP